MGLTGTGIQIGSATDFGASIDIPRGLATDGTTIWLISIDKAFTLVASTGVASPIDDNVSDFGASVEARAATYHDNKVLVSGYANSALSVYELDTDAGTLSEWLTSSLHYDDSSISGSPDIHGMASLNGTLYVLDRATDAIFTLIQDGSLVQVGSTAAGFGINALNARSLTVYRDGLIASDATLDKMFTVDHTDGSGTLLGGTNTLPEIAPQALLGVGEHLYVAGSASDAWFRLYDVRWDANIAELDSSIPHLEVDTGGNETWRLSAISQDADTLTLQGTPPSWISLSGTDLVATSAPVVSEDTVYSVTVRATRDSINADATFRIVVRASALGLTGTGVQVGSETQFGASIGIPRGLATDGTTVWLFSHNKAHTLNMSTGAATAIDNAVVNFGISADAQSATYHDNKVLVAASVSGTLSVYELDTAAGTLREWLTDDLHYEDNTITGTPNIHGMASLGGVLFVVDFNADRLMVLSQNGSLAQVGNQAAGFGINALSARSLTAFKNRLIASDSGLDKMFRVDHTMGDGTLIGGANTFPAAQPQALLGFDDALYVVDSGSDALFRLYEVQWDATIADFEVDEGENATWRLSDVSQDAASFSLQGTPPSWLSVSGTNLVVTTAPDVSADTNYDVTVRATRDGVNVDTVLRIVVKYVAPPAPTPTITCPVLILKPGETQTLSIAWDETVTGFVIGNISASAGTLSNLQGSGDAYTVDLTAPASGTGDIVVSIAENVLTPNNNAGSLTIPYRALPTPTITFDETEIGHGETATATIVWSEAVTGFAVGDLSVDVGSLSNFSGSGTTYTVDVTAPTSGTSLTLTIAENAIDQRNASATASLTLEIVATLTMPTSAEPNATVTGTIVFTGSVTGLTLDDLSTDLGTLANLQGSGQNWTVDLQLPATGTATVSLSADSVNEGNTAASDSVQIIQRIVPVNHQFLLIDTFFNVSTTVNAPIGTTIRKIRVSGLLQGFRAFHTLSQGNTVGTVNITGTPDSGVSGTWILDVTYSDGETAQLEIAYTAIPKTPSLTPVSRVKIYRNIDANLIIPITNYGGGASVKGRLIGLDHSDIANAQGEPLGVVVTATPLDTITVADNESLEIRMTHPMPGSPDIVGNQPYEVADETPPAMGAVSTSATTGGITFTWQAVPGATSYAYKLSTDENWVDVGNVTTHTIGDLASGTSFTYEWRVNSPWVGDAVSATEMTTTPATEPAKVTNVRVTRISATSYRVSWTAPADGGSDITDYEIKIGSADWLALSSTTTSTTITNATTGTTYAIQVRAVNSVGRGPASDSVSYTHASTPGTVRNLAATPSANGQITLSWTAPSSTGGSLITKYEYKKSTASSWTSAGTSLSVSISQTNGTSVTYQVRAVNRVGAGTHLSIVGRAYAPVRWTTASSNPSRVTTRVENTADIPFDGYQQVRFLGVDPRSDVGLLNRITENVDVSKGTKRGFTVVSVSLVGTGTGERVYFSPAVTDPVLRAEWSNLGIGSYLEFVIRAHGFYGTTADFTRRYTRTS